MMIGSKLRIGLAASIIGSLVGVAAQAAPKPVADVFSRGTQTQPQSNATVSSAQVPVKWFETFDAAIAAHTPTPADRVILSRPFNQDAGRVKEWTETAAKVAKNYRELAKMLKAMPIPSIMVGTEQYRDLTADWYDDAASVYEDLIRPHAPSKTMEELDSRLNQIRERSKGLAQTKANLKSMDMSLRNTYKVHQAAQTDALAKFVKDMPMNK